MATTRNVETPPNFVPKTLQNRAQKVPNVPSENAPLATPKLPATEGRNDLQKHVAPRLDVPSGFWYKQEKLDDGWPESVEEQGLLLLVWRRNIRNDI